MTTVTTPPDLQPAADAAAAPALPFAGTTVLVLGLGESGLAMARWCARGGAAVRVWDSRFDGDAAALPPNAAVLAEHLPAAVVIRGPLTDAAFDGVVRVLKSPGLSPADPRIAAPLAAAAARGLPVQGELALFAEALADLAAARRYTPKVVAITGTNGKTTTTAMAAKLIERAGLRVAMAGNIGPTMLQTLADALDAPPTGEDPAALPPLPEAWVLELSSFQLDGSDGFEPDAAALLNLTEDHLDWHGTTAAYEAAKARVFGRRSVMVVNRDDAAVERLVGELQPAPPEVAAGGRRRTAAAEAPLPPRQVVRFGLAAPRRAGDWGLVEDNGIAWLARALPPDEPPTPRGRRAGGAATADDQVQVQRLMPADALRVRGRHNAANALAALALATAIGCRTAPLLHALRDYVGEPHRVQHVATIAGVDVFDDSKGTNVGATVAALEGLGADRSMTRLVVILGGDGKGQDFTPLAGPVRRHVRAVATIGRDAAAIEAALADCGVPLARHDGLPAATRWAFAQARAGDALLLSPACASLDMFRNYAHRAEVFVAEVQALAAEHGEVLA